MKLKDLLSWMQGLPRYVAGMDLANAARSVGRGPEEVYPLNSNENLFIDREYMKGLMNEVVNEFDPRFYPKGEISELNERIASYLKINPNMVFVGFGSDQLIDLLTLMFRHSTIAFVEPTFPMYKIRAMVHRAKVLKFQYLEDFQMPIEKILTSSERIGALFFCSPNNPTGHVNDENEVKEILEGIKGIVVSDEAYSEISGTSLLKLLQKYDNLVILRSFSKAFGMAGLRLGYIVANEEIIELVKRVQHPFPITGFAVRLAMKVLEEVDKFEAYWNEARRVRDWVLKRFHEMDVKTTPSKTIFTVISTNLKQDHLFAELLKAGYLTRKISPFLTYKEPLRVTFAPKKVMIGFTNTLHRLLLH